MTMPTAVQKMITLVTWKIYFGMQKSKTACFDIFICWIFSSEKSRL